MAASHNVNNDELAIACQYGLRKHRSARILELPPPPSYPPPPVPEGKPIDGSVCSVFSDESTDCFSEPSENLDVPGPEVGEQAFDMCACIEIDFDSLEFELTPEDVSDHSSTSRTISRACTDEGDSEKLGLLLQPVPTRLNSRAKAWVPLASAPSASNGIACGQMLDILVAMQAAMVNSEFALDGEILQRPQGWAVIVYVHATSLCHKEQILDLGKAVLIESSKRSRSVCVIGYCSQPFVTTPMGFRAIVCDVTNSFDACWDFVTNGSCRYGKGCKWQHPNHLPIDVMIKIKILE